MKERVRRSRHLLDLSIVPKAHSYLGDGLFPNRIGLKRFIGLYLAEGSCSHHGISLAFNKNELELINFCLNFLRSNGYNANTQIVGNCCRVYAQKKVLKEFFKQFGKSDYKCMPAPLDNWSDLKVFMGWFQGDGNYDKEGIVGVSISRKLIYQMRDILFRNGIVCNMHQRKRGINTFPNSKDIYALTLNKYNTKLLLDGVIEKRHDTGIMYHKNHFLAGFKKRMINFKGKVYNISVEDDESYTVDGIKVHNCWMAFKFRGDQADTLPMAITLPGII